MHWIHQTTKTSKRPVFLISCRQFDKEFTQFYLFRYLEYKIAKKLTTQNQLHRMLPIYLLFKATVYTELNQLEVGRLEYKFTNKLLSRLTVKALNQLEHRLLETVAYNFVP